MKSKLTLYILIPALLVIGVLLWAGCERFSSVDREITITPASSLYTNDLNWVITFQAGEALAGTNEVSTSTNQLFYPLEWSVSDPSLGVFLSSTGNSAIYQSVTNVAGPNIIHCRDQSDREGSAVVVLTDPPETNLPPETSNTVIVITNTVNDATNTVNDATNTVDDATNTVDDVIEP